MKVIVKNIEELRLIDELSMSATCVHGKYYFLPYWYELKDGEIIKHSLDGDIPNELKNAIFDKRNKLT